MTGHHVWRASFFSTKISDTCGLRELAGSCEVFLFDIRWFFWDGCPIQCRYNSWLLLGCHGFWKVYQVRGGQTTLDDGAWRSLKMMLPSRMDCKRTWWLKKTFPKKNKLINMSQPVYFKYHCYVSHIPILQQQDVLFYHSELWLYLKHREAMSPWCSWGNPSCCKPKLCKDFTCEDGFALRYWR